MKIDILRTAAQNLRDRLSSGSADGSLTSTEARALGAEVTRLERTITAIKTKTGYVAPSVYGKFLEKIGSLSEKIYLERHDAEGTIAAPGADRDATSKREVVAAAIVDLQERIASRAAAGTLTPEEGEALVGRVAQVEATLEAYLSDGRFDSSEYGATLAAIGTLGKDVYVNRNKKPAMVSAIAP